MKVKAEDLQNLWQKNIAKIFRTTAIIMILSELTGVIAVFIDGIVVCRGVGVDAYSGISLLKPFTSIILMLAGFFSTGCNIACSRYIGVGKKDEANEAFNLSLFLALAVAVLVILLCLCFPDKLLNICGVSLTKYSSLKSNNLIVVT